METTNVSELDPEVKAVLEDLRRLLSALLPALAAVESLLDIPDEERCAGPEWLERLVGESG
jgi:hypothetical protein